MITYHQTSFSDCYHAGIIAVRYEVFVDEQHVPIELELDEFDHDAIHLVAVDDENVIGTCRVLQGDDYMKIGRLAVKNSHRHLQVGTRLMELALAIARKGGVPNVVLDSQITVIPFYEHFGFVASGEPFDDAGIPHKRMTLFI